MQSIWVFLFSDLISHQYYTRSARKRLIFVGPSSDGLFREQRELRIGRLLFGGALIVENGSAAERGRDAALVGEGCSEVSERLPLVFNGACEAIETAEAL